jgi:hypothetical protein
MRFRYAESSWSIVRQKGKTSRARASLIA